MKRYLLFAGSQYYPNGGWGDYQQSSDSLAKIKVNAMRGRYDWYHIVDSTTMKIIDLWSNY